MGGKKYFSYPAHVYVLKVQLNQCLMDFAQINQLDCIVILWAVFNVFPVLKINLYFLYSVEVGLINNEIWLPPLAVRGITTFYRENLQD